MLLESMKKGVSKIIIQIFAVLLIASFALWGVGDMVGVISNPDEVASVGDQKITQREFQEQFRRTMDHVRRNIGDIDAEEAAALGLVDSTLDGILDNRLMAMQATDLGLLVGDEQIASSIRANPEFRNALGEFDRAAFQSILANNGLTEGSYVASLRNDLKHEYLDQAVRSGVSSPPQLADIIYRHNNERRFAELVDLSRQPTKSAPAPSEGQLTSFLKDHQSSFMAPEYRRLTVLYLDPDDIAKEMSPSPESIREEYENRLDSIVIPERRRLRQILSQSKDGARSAHSALASGRSFASAAADSVGDDLGLVEEAELPPQISEAAFNLPMDGISDPIQTSFGWHVIQVTEIVPGRTPSLEEAKPEIRMDLARELALDDIVKRANRIEDTLAGGAGIEEAATEAGLRLQKPGPVDQELRSRSGVKSSGLPEDRNFVETAFATDNGSTSDLTETSNGGYFLLRVDEVTESAPRTLSEVRSDVVHSWKADYQDRQARKAAEAVLNEARNGRPLAAIASEKKLALKNGGPVTRIGGTDETIPDPLIPDLFKAKLNEYVLGPTLEGYAVARVTSIEGAYPDRESEQYKQLQQNLTANISNDLLNEYTNSLKNEYNVVINRRALDTIIAPRQ